MNSFHLYLFGSLILLGVSAHALGRSVGRGEPWGDHFGFVVASALFVAGGLVGLVAQ